MNFAVARFAQVFKSSNSFFLARVKWARVVITGLSEVYRSQLFQEEFAFFFADLRCADEMLCISTSNNKRNKTTNQNIWYARI